MDQASVRDSSLSKRHRGPDEPASGAGGPRTGVTRVLDVEILLHNVISALDATSTASFVEVLARNRQWLHCLQQPALWEALTWTHFGGLRVADDDPDVLVANNRHLGNAVFFVNPNDSDDDGGEDEERGDASEEEEEEEEPEFLAVNSGEEDPRGGEGNDAAGTTAEEQPGTEGQVASANHNGTGPVGTASAPVAAIPSASPLVVSLACGQLKGFLLSAEERKRFEENVVIVQGDIGEITELEGRAIDGIAFPTTSYLRNPRIGSAAVVHHRAGDELTQHIRSLDVVLSVSHVHVTPGFAAGVDKLIHVVGPSEAQHQCYQLLRLTYKNILTAAQRENLQCLALTSISTGNLGVPCKEGASMALRAIQRFLSQEKWPGVVGIVCYEAHVLDAFAQEKKARIDAFNVIPPYPEPSDELF
jgi:O-acetyl-ADP-ribose deacetylase (regulator of RNase III)